MQLFFAFLFFLLPAAMAARYDGVFKLLEAWDENSLAVDIPGDFNLVLQSEDESHYNLSLRIGNSLGARMAVETNPSGPDGVDVGPIMSTMKMPPENIFKLEQFMTSALEKATTIQLDQDKSHLVFEGEGTEKIVFQKE